MATLESLPADQRAVLQLVLQRGRSYDEIADMLSIDRAGVRQRALQALDALGPQTRVPAERRALITDYLLSQLPPAVAEDTRERLADSPAERAWARVIASELSPLAAKPLPEIPDTAPAPAATPAAAPPPEQPAPPRRERSPRPSPPEPVGGRRSSRTGGAILLGLLAVAIIAVVVVLIANSGGSSHKSGTTAALNTSTSTTTTASASSSVTPVAQINLTSPAGNKKLAGIAEVFKRGTQVGILIAAQNVPPNTKHNAYAVWLYNSPSDSRILGFVSPGVGTNGKLSTAGALPSDASRFKTLLITRETVSKPSQPGTIILQGALTGLS